jgi:hypothetical protein
VRVVADVLVVRDTTPISSARVPDDAILLNGKLTEDIWPEAIVKFVAVPIVAPVEFRNEMLPVHEAAVVVPVDEVAFEAWLTTVIWMVSVLPTPIGPIVLLCVEGVLVVVCAMARPDRRSVIATFRRNMDYLSLD